MRLLSELLVGMNLKRWRYYSLFNPAWRPCRDPDPGGRWDQEGIAKFRGRLWTLDLGKSGSIISRSLQGKGVLGDGWILTLIITILVLLGHGGGRKFCL